MRTIISKQLAHSSQQYRHIGVIGGVKLIVQLAQKVSVEHTINLYTYTVQSSILFRLRRPLDIGYYVRHPVINMGHEKMG